MNIEKIPTAEEFLNCKPVLNNRYTGFFADPVADWMIEFAKMHVEAALKEASTKVMLTDNICEALQEHWFEEYIDK